MPSHRLLWRVGVPFAALLLLALVGLAYTLSSYIDAADRRAFEELAQQNAAFLDQSSLSATEKLAEDLRRVTGHHVYARHRGVLAPRPEPEFVVLPLASVVPDGVAARRAGLEYVAVSMPGKGELVFVRSARSALFGPSVLLVFGGSLLLAVLAAWLVVRGIVGPLRNLARHLPAIETVGPIELPEATRPDELGDLARAFLRTRTALHEAQQSRQRVEKLAVLGRMTAALAHEVQNPVAAIRIHAQLWRGDSGHPSAQTIEYEAARIESLLNQWLYLTRPEPPAVADLDLGAELARIVEMQHSQAEHAAVTVRLEAPLGEVVAADRRRLEQVFRNLLTNACQAMPGGGTLTIRTRLDGDSVCVDFIDNGPGFSPTALERFGEFFFSEREGGMGIGLSVAREIVRAHQGELSVHNQPAGGAVVTVRLPRRAEVVA
ncbi:MAG: HAMP domain-containing protein [Planctomycetes bacterium]|nr:HAMP domain-containing protein [Planctomycetota bacterium]